MFSKKRASPEFHSFFLQLAQKPLMDLRHYPNIFHFAQIFHIAAQKILVLPKFLKLRAIVPTLRMYDCSSIGI